MQNPLRLLSQRQSEKPDLNRIYGPDVTMPVGHVAPAPEAARTEIRSLVRRLAPDGIDAGTDSILDETVDSWTEQWLSRLDDEHAVNDAVGTQLVGKSATELERCTAEHEAAQARLTEVDYAYGAVRGQLGGQRAPRGAGENAVERNGHAATHLLGGRPRSQWLHIVALLFAGCADFAAFYQVIALVMRTSPPVIIALVVLGCSSTALYLMHAAGCLLRQRQVGDSSATRFQLAGCVASWAVLGLGALTIRLLVDNSSAQGSTLPVIDGTAIQTQEDPGVVYANALVFFALYVASGCTAAIGAWFTHNPIYAGYTRLAKNQREVTEAATAAATAQRRAAQAHEYRLAHRQYNEARCAAARAERLALAKELKEIGRIEMAIHLQDPAVTDGMNTAGRGDTGRPDLRAV